MNKYMDIDIVFQQWTLLFGINKGYQSNGNG